MDGAELRRLRMALGMNQSQMARALDVPVQTVTRWESGKLGIRHPVILDYALRYLLSRNQARIAAALDVAPGELLKGDGDG